jgi:hypothetical protein
LARARAAGKFARLGLWIAPVLFAAPLFAATARAALPATADAALPSVARAHATLRPAASAHTKRIIFTDTAESRVVQARPDQNYHGQPLEARGGSGLTRSYLKFTVSGLTGTVTRARLWIVPENPSRSGFSVYGGASNDWTETGVTWHNAPAMQSAVLGSSGAYACSRTCRVGADVTSLVDGNGTYTIVIGTQSASSEMYFRHKRARGGGSAELIVRTSAEEPEREPPGESVWTAVGKPPLSDAQAAALVTHKPEQRPENVGANDYVPAPAQLQSFHAAGDSANPLNRYVDGLDGLSNPSTDDLIQWGARKWGIPDDWLRAEYVQESGWHQHFSSDRAKVSAEWWALYPPEAKLPGDEVNESMGITQIKWRPDNSVGPGTEPLRWLSTAFNIDYQAAAIRYYYDGYCTWCGAGYSAGQQWNSIGAWFSPYPWANSGAQSYIHSVQGYLATKPWTSPGF